MSRLVQSYVRSRGAASTTDIQNYVISTLGGTARQAYGAIGYCRRMRWIHIVSIITNNGRDEHIFRV